MKQAVNIFYRFNVNLSVDGPYSFSRFIFFWSFSDENEKRLWECDESFISKISILKFSWSYCKRFPCSPMLISNHRWFYWSSPTHPSNKNEKALFLFIKIKVKTKFRLTLLLPRLLDLKSIKTSFFSFNYFMKFRIIKLSFSTL